MLLSPGSAHSAIINYAVYPDNHHLDLVLQVSIYLMISTSPYIYTFLGFWFSETHSLAQGSANCGPQAISDLPIYLHIVMAAFKNTTVAEVE